MKRKALFALTSIELLAVFIVTILLPFLVTICVMPTEYFSFRESAAFTKRLPKHLTEDGYFALQDYLLENPDEGDVIPGGKGIRKLRWRAAHHLLLCR